MSFKLAYTGGTVAILPRPLCYLLAAASCWLSAVATGVAASRVSYPPPKSGYIKILVWHP